MGHKAGINIHTCKTVQIKTTTSSFGWSKNGPNVLSSTIRWPGDVVFRRAYLATSNHLDYSTFCCKISNLTMIKGALPMVFFSFTDLTQE